MTAAFADRLASRNAGEYADFVLPYLNDETSLLDVGCGSGEITVGLAGHTRTVVGVDQVDHFSDARHYAESADLNNISFASGDVYSLDFEDNSFDICFSHSLLEALRAPESALREMHRVLRPGGTVAVASVEYSGIILAGDELAPMTHFYRIREELWQRKLGADPFLGSRLRELLHRTGFEKVLATSKYFSYGTREAIADFGKARAADCRDQWYRESAMAEGLATESQLEKIEDAWLSWSESPDAYFAFPGCRALGHKPRDT